MLPFWVSIAILSLLQGALVAIPRAGLPWESRAQRRSPGWRARLDRLGAGAWGLIPPASVVVFVLVAQAGAHASAETLTYVALVAVPLLAALALGWLTAGARPAHALFALALFALAWADRGGLAGHGAAVLLSALSCAALGVILARVTPARWLALGILAMAIADTAFVLSDLLQRPNSVLNAAHPAAGLPRLQSAAFGSAVMGYGDLFVAGVLGGLVARRAGRRTQLRAAAVTALFALGFDLLFFAVSELPATVPVALALLALSGELGLRGERRDTVPQATPLPGGGRGYSVARLDGPATTSAAGQRLSAPDMPPGIVPPRGAGGVRGGVVPRPAVPAVRGGTQPGGGNIHAVEKG